jgi:hypothetical protein
MEHGARLQCDWAATDWDAGVPAFIKALLARMLLAVMLARLFSRA